MAGRLTVLIDATAVPADRGGVGRYVDGVVSELQGQVVVVCQERDRDLFAELNPRAEIVAIPGIASTARRLLWEQLGLPRLAKKVGADVIHSPHYTFPVLTRRARVVTFHDATFFSDPGVHTATKRVFFRAWMRAAVRAARRILVPSEATAREVARYLRTASARYDVAYHGVDRTRFRPPTSQEVEEFATHHGIDGKRWIGFLGTLEPRKNLVSLIRAHARLSERDPSTPVLALAGGAGWDRGIDPALRGSSSVLRLGYLPAHELPAFLGGAELVVYPSLGEGFGLPVLEAMACRSAVLTTPRLALPEVGGDAVAYTEPDEGALLTALEQLLADADERGRLAAAGEERAASFTWRASAEVHERVYREAAGDAR